MGMNAGEQKANIYTPFWPLFLLALSLVLFLGWQVMGAMRQRSTLLRMQGQQEILAAQAAEAENRLQPLLMDLVNLARTDADAKAIVAKYRINIAGGAQAVAAVPSPGVPSRETAPQKPVPAAAPAR